MPAWETSWPLWLYARNWRSAALVPSLTTETPWKSASVEIRIG